MVCIIRSNPKPNMHAGAEVMPRRLQSRQTGSVRGLVNAVTCDGGGLSSHVQCQPCRIMPQLSWRVFPRRVSAWDFFSFRRCQRHRNTGNSFPYHSPRNCNLIFIITLGVSALTPGLKQWESRLLRFIGYQVHTWWFFFNRCLYFKSNTFQRKQIKYSFSTFFGL